MGILEDVLSELDRKLSKLSIQRGDSDLYCNYQMNPHNDGLTLMYADRYFIVAIYERGKLLQEFVYKNRQELMYFLLKLFISEEASRLAAGSPASEFRKQYFANQLKLFSKISLEYALWRKQEILEILKRYPD